MTSIAKLAVRIKEDNEAIIKNQDKANKSLDSIDTNFTKFFSIQERNRLDNLESKLDASRKTSKAARGSGRGIVATAAAVANPFNWAKALTPGNIAKALFTTAGILAIKPTLKALEASAKTLQNLFDDAAKTQRGLNRFAADDLRVKEQAKAKAAKLEEQRLKAEQKRLEAQRRAAILEEKARVKRVLLAQENMKAQALQAAENARLQRLDVEARLDKTKTARTEAGIAKQQALQNARILKDVKNMPKIKQEPILRSMTSTLGDVQIVRTAPGKLNIPEVPSSAFKAPVAPRAVKKKIVGTSVKVAGGALLAVDAALAMAAEVQRAKDEQRTLKQAEIESAGLAAVITAPFALFDFAVNSLASGIEKVGNSVGYTFPDAGERLDMAGGMSKDLRTGLNAAQKKLNIGQGEANKTLVDGVVATDAAVKKMWSNIVGAFTGTNTDTGSTLAGYQNMSQQGAGVPSINPVNQTTNNYKISSPGASGMGSTTDGNDKLMEAMSIQ